MKINKVICPLLALCLMAATVQAQNSVFSQKPEAFGASVANLMEATGSNLASQTGTRFSEIWETSKFSSEEQELIMGIAQKMQAKKFKARPRPEAFFATINAAVSKQSSSDEILAFLQTTDEVLNRYSNKQVERFLLTARLLFEENALYKSNNFDLRLDNQQFIFKFVDGTETPVEEEPPVQEEYFQEEEKEEEEAEIDWSSVNWDEVNAAPEERSTKDVLLETMPQNQPPIYGAVIEFSQANLVFRNKYDSTTVYDTKGTYMFETDQFIGQKGKIDWTNSGLDRDEVYAELDLYDFKVRDNRILAERVMMHYQHGLEEPIQGVLEYAGQRNKNQAPTYPRFKSYQSDIQLKNLGGDGMVHTGGFAMRGSRLYSTSAFGELSTLEGFHEGERRFKAVSTIFNFNEDSTVTSRVAAIILYQGADSVYHPAVRFEYNIPGNRLRLKSASGGFKNTPYNTSMFKIDISADLVQWDIKQDSLDFSVVTARDEKPVLAESQDFFSYGRFEQLAGIYSFHPLMVLINYSRKINSTEFYLEELKDATGIQEDLLKNTIKDLMQRGMVSYDNSTQLIKISRKGYHYVLSKDLRKDYDDMIIPSIIESTPNATLYFDEGRLKMRGVESFYVSDSLDVIITPTNKEISILKNRDIEFDGSLNAGNIQFNGQQFRFNYDDFLVNLSKIDSIKLEVSGENGKQRLDNQLVETSGTLYINKPFNKSGRRSYPKYPIFNSDKTAVVYFNKPTVLGGAYDSTMYFDVPPFELDSAADADPSTLAFNGTFTSGGIFPDFKERLVAMPDNSLGFEHSVPVEGYSLYGKSANIKGGLRMDADGLTSDGDIAYLTGLFKSDGVTFYLDSMYSDKGTEATINAGTLAGTSYPSVQLTQYEMNWHPKKDSMRLANLDVPFKLYDEAADFDGAIVLSSKSLKGGGEFVIEGSKTNSENFNFEETQFLARNAGFQIDSNNPRKPVLLAEDIRLDYNLSAQNALVQPEVQGAAALEFPFAQYKTSIPTANWDFAAQTITFSKPDTVDISKSYFYATREELDSLSFNASGGVYDIEKLELKVEGIPYITVADANITPENNEVLILENAKIGTLSNAEIIIDTANAFHRVYDATVNIVSRNEFNGSGTYELINTVQDTFAIKFSEFAIEEDEINGKFTKASGRVLADAGIVVSPGFTFKGDVFMYAYRKALELDGAVKLNLEKIKERNIWIEYASNDDVQEVIIPFDEAQTENGDPLNAGLHFNNGEIYLSFITEKRGIDDEDFFIPSGGNLSYDADTNAYKIENPLKIQGEAYAGSMFSYNEDSQEVGFEGKLNFIGDYNKGLTMRASGIGKGRLDSATFEVDALMAVDYQIPDEVLPIMALDLNAIGDKLGVARAHDDRSDLVYKVAEIIGDEATKNWDNFSLSTYTPLVSMSPAMIADLAITKVDMKWSKVTNSFYSEGKIWLSNVGASDVNMEIDGFVEIRKTPEGNMVNILLQVTDGTWYFFGYDGSTLATFSSNTAYNQIILENANSGKIKVGQFRYFAASLEEVSAWARNFRKLYYGIDEPYRLQMATDSAQVLKKKDDDVGDGF